MLDKPYWILLGRSSIELVLYFLKIKDLASSKILVALSAYFGERIESNVRECNAS